MKKPCFLHYLYKMIVEFSVTNFRSIKEKQTFSLVAESTKNKRETNTFTVEIGKKDKITLLKSAVVFGANASGKSNLIKAFKTFRQIITVSRGPHSANNYFEPFLFNTDTPNKDTEFECVFILGGFKFIYSIAYNKSKISFEELSYFPKNVKKVLFKRIIEKDNLSDSAKFATDAEEIDLKILPQHFRIFKNQAVLSKFGLDIAEPFLYKIYSYFFSWKVWSDNSARGISSLSQSIISGLGNNEEDPFFKKLERLISAADTKIASLSIRNEDDGTGVYWVADGETVMIDRAQKTIFGKHLVSGKDGDVSHYELPFSEESAGTNVLFALGAYILEAIEEGGVVIFDELDNSLHPKLARFLVSLFNNVTINKKNAQIIFTSHEANLIDKDMFRSDQIWFAAKNDKGETDIYSAQDFEGIREDIPFDKWYLAGKFGALPNIQDMESIFENGEKSE